MPAEELNAGDQLFVCLTPQSGGLSPEKMRQMRPHPGGALKAMQPQQGWIDRIGQGGNSLRISRRMVREYLSGIGRLTGDGSA
jgi:hypothetical protein